MIHFVITECLQAYLKLGSESFSSPLRKKEMLFLLISSDFRGGPVRWVQKDPQQQAEPQLSDLVLRYALQYQQIKGTCLHPLSLCRHGAFFSLGLKASPCAAQSHRQTLHINLTWYREEIKGSKLCFQTHKVMW